jgi:hypothetical protein
MNFTRGQTPGVTQGSRGGIAACYAGGLTPGVTLGGGR